MAAGLNHSSRVPRIGLQPSVARIVSPTCGEVVTPGASTEMPGEDVWLKPGMVLGLAAVSAVIVL